MDVVVTIIPVVQLVVIVAKDVSSVPFIMLVYGVGVAIVVGSVGSMVAPVLVISGS